MTSGPVTDQETDRFFNKTASIGPIVTLTRRRRRRFRDLTNEGLPPLPS